jgi:hypothetical protein
MCVCPRAGQMHRVDMVGGPSVTRPRMTSEVVLSETFAEEGAYLFLLFSKRKRSMLLLETKRKVVAFSWIGNAGTAYTDVGGGWR